VEQETYPVSLNTLWKKLDWDKATILRMCNTLERRGYLHRDPASKLYSLGVKIFGLYESIVKNIDVQRTARPYLVQLQQETGESAHLAFVFEKHVVFVDKVIGSQPLPINVQIGGREPLHCTALGKAFLAFTPAADRAALLEYPLRKYTDNSVDTMQRLNDMLRIVKERGYALDDEEYIPGVCCVASPILDQGGRAIAAVGIAASKARLPLSTGERYGRYIKNMALKISGFLGFQPDQNHVVS